MNPHTRYAKILWAYGQWAKPLTDRQIGEELGFKDLNAVKPRISEMVNGRRGNITFDPMLIRVDKIVDGTTGTKVRRCTLMPEQGMLFA